ncbi:MAG: DUF59 domain-containing protein [Alphaproteobacteria bacterium]|nr:DUF59 domain-containing protein [Alphaproteobacteria bacterium]MDD9919122.1 DUF59 domain-containing protein [Alphaproteobacteria bacterium]
MAKVQIQTTPEIAQDTGLLPVDASLKERVIHALQNVYDPELPVNVYDLGLIYEVAINGNHVAIEMTLTAPNCPVADQIPKDVEIAVRAVNGVHDVTVSLVWEPKWTKDRMSDAAKVELGWF